MSWSLEHLWPKTTSADCFVDGFLHGLSPFLWHTAGASGEADVEDGEMKPHDTVLHSHSYSHATAQACPGVLPRSGTAHTVAGAPSRGPADLLLGWGQQSLLMDVEAAVVARRIRVIPRRVLHGPSPRVAMTEVSYVEHAAGILAVDPPPRARRGPRVHSPVRYLVSQQGPRAVVVARELQLVVCPAALG